MAVMLIYLLRRGLLRLFPRLTYYFGDPRRSGRAGFFAGTRSTAWMNATLVLALAILLLAGAIYIEAAASGPCLGRAAITRHPQ